MRIRCASKMPKKCAYLNAFQKRIKCASEIRNQKILSYAFQMRFRCISKMLKRFDAKLETFQMRFVFTGLRIDEEQFHCVISGVVVVLWGQHI